MMGKEIKELGIVACDKFQPIALEGQRCFSLDLRNVEDVNKSMTGKTSGLTLVLDPNTLETDMFARIYLHTLSPFTDFRNGSYAMSVLKKMTGTKGFLKNADEGETCQIEEFEKCNTREYVGLVSDKCQCTLWALNNGNSQQVHNFFLNFYNICLGPSLLHLCILNLHQFYSSWVWKLQSKLHWPLC